MIKRLHAKLVSLVTRVLVDRSGDGSKVPTVQVVGMGGHAHDAEVFLPQGLYFRAPAGAEGVELAAGGSRAAAVLLAAHDRGSWPAGGGIPDGTGGLHYLGAWKVYLDDQGNVHLGEKEGETAIPRDDLVQAELARLKGELETVKSNLEALAAIFDTGVPGSADGGAALQTAWAAAAELIGIVSPADPGPTASTYGKIT